MFQRDYILRLIEMMGDLARRVAELMDELDQMKLLDDHCREHCGMPVKALETLSVESLCDMLAPKPRLYASELCYLRAMLPSTQWEARDALLMKSLRLLTTLSDEGPLCEARLGRMRELKAALLPKLNAGELMACALFFAQAESYGEMEDTLFQSLEPGRGCEASADYAWKGASLLRQAAHASDKALALCGMTSQELRLAARELEQWKNKGV